MSVLHYSQLGILNPDINTMSFLEEGLLVAVALLWGATNPYLKKGSAGVENVKAVNPFQQKIAEIVFLATRWSYIVPFALNQLGTILFYTLLQDSDLTLAVPVTNSLAFVATAVVSHLLGEQVTTWRTNMGIFMIVAGTSICMFEKATVVL